ncbi:hypothetical protein Aduo_006906 [Ancylostoma duodenale]
MGRAVSMNDAMFSCDIVLPFFEKLHEDYCPPRRGRDGVHRDEEGIHEGVDRHLLKFRGIGVERGHVSNPMLQSANQAILDAGAKREKTIKTELDRARQVLHSLREESRLTATWKGVARFLAAKLVSLAVLLINLAIVEVSNTLGRRAVRRRASRGNASQCFKQVGRDL